jgi:hypothetical protein
MSVADHKPRATVPTPPATLSNASGFRARVSLSVSSLSEGREEAGPGGPSYASTSYSESLSDVDCSRHVSSFGIDDVGGVITSMPSSSANAAANALAAVLRPRGDTCGDAPSPNDTRGIRHAPAGAPRRVMPR